MLHGQRNSIHKHTGWAGKIGPKKVGWGNRTHKKTAQKHLSHIYRAGEKNIRGGCFFSPTTRRRKASTARIILILLVGLASNFCPPSKRSVYRKKAPACAHTKDIARAEKLRDCRLAAKRGWSPRARFRECFFPGRGKTDGFPRPALYMYAHRRYSYTAGNKIIDFTGRTPLGPFPIEKAGERPRRK